MSLNMRVITKQNSTLLMVPIILVMTVVSCSLRNYQKPSDPVADEQQFQLEENRKFKAAEPVEDWWSRFGDKDLDTLVSRALDHNLDIDVAVANVRQSRALMRESGFNLFPVVQAEGGYRWERQSEEAGIPITERDIEIYDVGLNTSWELDLFGRVSQQKKAVKATYQASFAELRGAYVSVTSEVALAYMQLRGAQQRLSVAKQNVENQEETYELSRALVDGGSGSELDMVGGKPYTS
jgi:multidrug efflux system outer membrane protein